MKAKVIQATINGQVKWRLYYEQEVIALFESQDMAQQYADFLNGMA